MKVIMPLWKLKVYRQWDCLRCHAKLHNRVYRRPAPIDHKIPIDISPSSSSQRFLWAVTSNLQRTTMPLPGCALHHEGLRPCHCPMSMWSKEFRGTHCPETVVVVTVEKKCDSPFPRRQPWSSDPPVLNSDGKDVVMDASLSLVGYAAVWVLRLWYIWEEEGSRTLRQGAQTARSTLERNCHHVMDTSTSLATSITTTRTLQALSGL